MNTAGNVAQFTTVDSAPDTSFFIDFMDVANALPEYRRIRQGLVNALGPLAGAAVLEVGCGTGDDARDLARLVRPGGRVVATDLSEAMVVEARRRSAGSPLPVEFETADIRDLRFVDGTFDGVHAKLVLMHCADIETALDELVRVLRPGGRIAVFDLDFDMVIVDHPDRSATRKALRSLTDGISNGWSGRELKRRLLLRGLRDVTIVPQTVITPFAFFDSMVAGPLAGAQAAGRLEMSADELRAWWQPLVEADRVGRFFASFTGFVVGAVRPGRGS